MIFGRVLCDLHWAPPDSSRFPVLELSSSDPGLPCANEGDTADILCDPGDIVLATQQVLTTLTKKLAFTTHILEAASLAPRLFDHEYQPLSLPHCPPTVMQSNFRLNSAQLRLLFYEELHGNPVVHDVAAATTFAKQAKAQHLPRWILVASDPLPPRVMYPPMFLVRFVLCVLHAVNVWTHAPALCGTVNLPLRSAWSDIRHIPPNMTHCLVISLSLASLLPSRLQHPVIHGSCAARLMISRSRRM